MIDAQDFVNRIVKGYNEGWGPEELPADESLARSFVPAGTAAYRDFSNISPELPEFLADRCTGCMECVTACPDTAILGKVMPESALPRSDSALAARSWARTKKYFEGFEKRGQEGGLFGIFIDPTKCKGCAECVAVCDDRGTQALKMIPKVPGVLDDYRRAFEIFQSLGETPRGYLIDKSLPDMMLAERALLYTGGAGSCMGCGEGTAIRMMLAATGFAHGERSVGIVAATGCNTVFGSTYPFNPYRVPWTNSLFENAAPVALGVRISWDRRGWREKKIWVLGGDGAMGDIGFQALSRLLATGADVNVLVLDTQVYSNTGGQASMSSFMGQDAKFSAVGSEGRGKSERRKELGQILLMHPDTFVAQTTPAHVNHFYKAVMAANDFQGPAVVIAYATCQPEHGVGDAEAAERAKMAVMSRAFPLFIYDPRKGSKVAERLSLWGNPAEKSDWWVNPKTGERVDFIDFARGEGRFARHFDAQGRPSEMLQAASEERLANWRRLQELAGTV
jgi:pyruvate/2-oxoacid:ferredoxin oxidoreductase beta subunit/Pyruvate/2-oxoacid:ferredoxin oxidoreductase delta subunit